MSFIQIQEINSLLPWIDFFATFTIWKLRQYYTSNVWKYKIQNPSAPNLNKQSSMPTPDYISLTFLFGQFHVAKECEEKCRRQLADAFHLIALSRLVAMCISTCVLCVCMWCLQNDRAHQNTWTATKLKSRCTQSITIFNFNRARTRLWADCEIATIDVIRGSLYLQGPLWH